MMDGAKHIVCVMHNKSIFSALRRKLNQIENT
jgi:hypothetical protein